MLHVHYHVLTQWLHANPHWGWLAAFLIAFGESVAIIGSIIPGSVTMTAIGILIGSSVLPLWSTLLWAIFGAILGDGLSYFAGRYFKNRLHVFWPFSKHPKLLAKGQRFVFKHGGKSIFIGRFVGPVRAIVPLITGMLNMRPKKYFIASIPAAIAWAPVYMLPGILVGAASLEMPADVATSLIVFVLLLLVAIWAIIKITGYVYDKTHFYFSSILDAKWKIWAQQPSKKWICYSLHHAGRPQQRGQLLLAIHTVLALLLFLILFANVFFHGPLLNGNQLVYHLFRGIRTLTLDKVIIVITSLGYFHVLVTLLIALFIWFLLHKRFLTAWHWLGGCILCIGAIFVFKHLGFSPRPTGILKAPSSSSFPSGHTALAITFYGLLGFFMAKNASMTTRKVIYWIVALIMISVGFSRLYLGVHWLTDVVGGALLGLFCLGITIISFQRHRAARLSLWKTALIALLALIIADGFYLSKNYHRNLHNYQPYWPTHQLSQQIWWQQHSRLIPLYRKNRLGLPEEILNVQWAGHLKDIKSTLQKNGWQNLHTRNYITTLKKLTQHHKTLHHILLPKLYNDQHPVMEATKTLTSRRSPITLLLWRSNIQLPNHTPLWVGIITYDKTNSKFSIFHRQKTKRPRLKAYQILFYAVPRNIWQRKIIRAHHVPKKLKQPHEVIKILLIKPKN